MTTTTYYFDVREKGYKTWDANKQLSTDESILLNCAEELAVKCPGYEFRIRKITEEVIWTAESA